MKQSPSLGCLESILIKDGMKEGDEAALREIETSAEIETNAENIEVVEEVQAEEVRRS